MHVWSHPSSQVGTSTELDTIFFEQSQRVLLYVFARVYAAVSSTNAETMMLCIYQQTDSSNCRMWGISFQTLMNPSKECWGFRRGLRVEGS